MKYIKILGCLLISILLIGLIFLYLTYRSYENAPDGLDVSNSFKVSKEVNDLLVNSLGEIGPHVNVVMMDERRRGFAVCIRNPKPSVEDVRDIIYKNRDKITGDNLDLSFYDRDMKILESVRIMDSDK